MRGTKSYDARYAVVRKETLEETRSYRLLHAEVLKETLEENRSSGLLRAEVLSVKTVRKILEVLCCSKTVRKT